MLITFVISQQNDMKENKKGNTLHAFIKSILIKSLLKSHTQNYHPASLRKRSMGGWEVCPKTTLLNLRQNWWPQ